MKICKKCGNFLLLDHELQLYICDLCGEEYKKEDAEECLSQLLLTGTVWPLL